RAGADAARVVAALGRRARHGVGDRRAPPRRRLHDPRHTRRAHVRPRAAEHGTERDVIHRVRPDRPARAQAERHHRRPADARAARVDAVTLWAGRVDTELAPEVWDFLRANDDELLPYDVEGTLIHAARLHEAGLLDDAELDEVRSTLATLH